MTSEFELIERHFTRPTPSAVLGPGDDCALVAPAPGCELAISTDMLVAGTHFFADTEPQALGWKALAVNISDLAAMGARPRWALLAGALPQVDENWLAAFTTGFFSAASAYGVDLIGGDTTRGPLNLCVTVIGEVKTGQALRRDRAQPGDDLWVSGLPGLAAMGLAHLQNKIRLPEAALAPCLDALYRPQARVALGLGLSRLAHAAIDISDGLIADVAHILERSHLCAELFIEKLPAPPAEYLNAIDPAFFRSCQLAGGDDYELAFTAPPAAQTAIDALSDALSLPLHRIGRILGSDAGAAGQVTVYDTDGNPLAIDRKGYDHFG